MFTGMEVTTDYDSMLGKLIVWAESRGAAVRRMQCTLKEFRISGIKTDLPFLTQILQSDSFMKANFDTTYLDHHQPTLLKNAKNNHGKLIAIALAKMLHEEQTVSKAESTSFSTLQNSFNPWRMAAVQEQVR